MTQPKGFFKEGGKTKPRHDKKGITEDKLSVSVKGNNDTIEVGTKPHSHAVLGLDVSHNKFAPEIKRAYLDKKEDVDDLLKSRLDLLKKKHGDNIVMQSIMLTARPFQNETTFVVTFTNPKKDKDYEQWYINEKISKNNNKPTFEVNRSH